MNYFAHALSFLENPYYLAGTAVPDWLTVVDRPVRVRSKRVEPFLLDRDPATAEVAGGLLQHLRDDRRFHETRAFAETSLEISASVRRRLGEDGGFRASFLGHILVEVLLDATLARRHPDKLAEYYRVLEQVDAAVVQQAVNRMVPRPTARLVVMMEAFRRERILYDYAEDDRLLVRMNQVMRRLGFELLPEVFREVLPAARGLVDARCEALLEGIPA